MGLATHLFRRGAVYWWRHRIGYTVMQHPCVVAFSLRTYEPRVAKRMAVALSATVVVNEISGAWRMLADPPSIWWTPMLGFRASAGMSYSQIASFVSGQLQA